MTTATTERPALTERQAEVLGFFRDYSRKHGMPPRLRDISRWFGLASPSSGPLCHLQALYRKGYLRRTNKGRYRGYALAVEPGCCACCGQPLPTEPRP